MKVYARSSPGWTDWIDVRTTMRASSRPINLCLCAHQARKLFGHLTERWAPFELIARRLKTKRGSARRPLTAKALASVRRGLAQARARAFVADPAWESTEKRKAAKK